MTLKLGYKRTSMEEWIAGSRSLIIRTSSFKFLMMPMFSPRKKIPRINFILETNLSAVPLYLRDNALHSGAYGAMHITGAHRIRILITVNVPQISSQAHFLFLRRKPLPASNSFSLASHRKVLFLLHAFTTYMIIPTK